MKITTISCCAKREQLHNLLPSLGALSSLINTLLLWQKSFFARTVGKEIETATDGLFILKEKTAHCQTGDCSIAKKKSFRALFLLRRNNKVAQSTEYSAVSPWGCKITKKNKFFAIDFRALFFLGDFLAPFLQVGIAILFLWSPTYLAGLKFVSRLFPILFPLLPLCSFQNHLRKELPNHVSLPFRIET